MDVPEAVTVGELLEHLPGAFNLISGPQGMDRAIRQTTVQRIGVALTGHIDHLEHDRVQMVGQAEGGYLSSQPADARRTLLETVFSADFPALFVTAAQTPPEEMLVLADRYGIALIGTALGSTQATQEINRVLSDALARREQRHGVLVDVFGVGVLLLGKSGIGKSEVALELISAGHRLVADDAVILHQEDSNYVTGSCPPLTRHHIEIRGLGILNIKELFGAASVRKRKRVELVAEMVEWDNQADYDRLGLDEQYMELAGVSVPHVTLPVRPGRSLRLILEIAARERLLRAQGQHSARRFAERLEAHLTGVVPLPTKDDEEVTRSE